MDKRELAREDRLQNRLEAFDCGHPKCGMCGEDNPHCLESHHVAGRRYDDATVYLCCNCHRKVTDDQKDHPPAVRNGDTTLEAIGRFLLGLADMLRRIVASLAAFGHYLIERAALDAGCLK